MDIQVLLRRSNNSHNNQHLLRLQPVPQVEQHPLILWDLACHLEVSTHY